MCAIEEKCAEYERQCNSWRFYFGKKTEVNMAPMGDYTDFQDCVDKNASKDDPEAYCAAIKRQIEGKGMVKFLKSALEGFSRMIAPKDKPVKPIGNFSLQKDAKGDWRWVGVVSNNFRDKDNPPQIIETKAHEEYVNFLDKQGEFPVIELWHTDGTEIGKADFAEFSHGFLVMSGTINKDKGEVAEKLANIPDLGMSHGFEYTYANADKEIIGFYRIKEVSVLPVTFAANPWTSIEMLKKEKSMREEKKQFLTPLLGAETVEALDKGLADRQKQNMEAGVEFKEKTPEAEPVAEVKAELTPEAILAMVKESDAFKSIETLTNQVKEIAVALVALKEQTDKNMAQIKSEVKKSQDDLVASAIKARGTVAQPSKDKGNIIKEGDPLAKVEPALTIDKGLAESLKAIYR